MHHADSLDLMLAIFAELGFDHLCIDAMAPVGLYHLDIQAQFCCHLNPQRGELSHLEHQYFVAGRQSVG